jgi:hypothetical protein
MNLRLLSALGLALAACQSQEPTAKQLAPAPSAAVPASGEPLASVAASASESAAAPVVSAVVSASSSANPDPQAARQAALREAAEFGLIDMKNAGVAGDPNAPKAPWGRDDSPGGAMSARGNLWGDEIGDNYGAGGLGLRGTGPGGRGEGIGLGNPDSISGRAGSARPKGPSVRMGATTVNGRLPPEVIQRIVRQQFGRFRQCYEKALTANPTLAGKVTTTFTIRTDGSTEGVSTNSDLADKDVATCVGKVFAILSYPQPEGGVVKVSYPIFFSPGEGTTKTEPSKAEPTIAGKPLAEVTALEVEKALRDAGFTEVSSRVPSGGEAVVFTAKKGTRTFTLTFVSKQAGKDALSAEERKRLLGAAKVYTDFGIFLAVESDDAAESQALLDLLIKPVR